MTDVDSELGHSESETDTSVHESNPPHRYRRASRGRRRRRGRYYGDRRVCCQDCLPNRCGCCGVLSWILAFAFPPYGYYLLLRRTLLRFHPGLIIFCGVPIFYSVLMVTLIVCGACFMALTQGRGLDVLLNIIRMAEKQIRAFAIDRLPPESVWTDSIFAFTSFLRILLASLGGALAYTGGSYEIGDIVLYAHTATIGLLKFLVRLIGGLGNAFLGYDVD